MKTKLSYRPTKQDEIEHLKKVVENLQRELEKSRIENFHQKELQAHEIKFRQFAVGIAEQLANNSPVTFVGNQVKSYEEYLENT